MELPYDAHFAWFQAKKEYCDYLTARILHSPVNDLDYGYLSFKDYRLSQN